MPTVVLGSQIFEVVPTVQATGSSGGDQLLIAAGNTIPAIQGGAGAPSGTATYGVGSLYVDTTNSDLYLNTTGSTWVALTPPSNQYVASNIAGTGIGVSGATGNVTINNTGVLSAAGGTNDILTNGSVAAATGAVTFSIAQPQTSIVAAQAIAGTTETLIAKLAIGSTIIAGDSYIIEGFGTYTNSSATARTSTFTIRCGTAGTTADTSLGTVGAMTGSGSVTNIPFFFKIMVTFWTAGATGTALVNGMVNTNGTTGIIATAGFVSGNTAATTINTTNNNFLDLSYTSNNASGTATFRNVTIHKVR